MVWFFCQGFNFRSTGYALKKIHRIYKIIKIKDFGMFLLLTTYIHMVDQIPIRLSWRRRWKWCMAFSRLGEYLPVEYNGDSKPFCTPSQRPISSICYQKNSENRICREKTSDQIRMIQKKSNKLPWSWERNMQNIGK